MYVGKERKKERNEALYRATGLKVCNALCWRLMIRYPITTHWLHRCSYSSESPGRVNTELLSCKSPVNSSNGEI